jgi:hypothetical protein
MANEDINRGLIDSMGKYPVVSGTGYDDVSATVGKEVLRKKKHAKSKTTKRKKKGKKDCGCK